MKLQVAIPKSFILIFTIDLLLMLGVLANLNYGNTQEPSQDAGDTQETATPLALGTPSTPKLLIVVMWITSV